MEDALYFHFDNEGIITNYYETRWNTLGKLYMTLSPSNEFHLFIPDSLTHLRREMLTGKFGILTVTTINDALFDLNMLMGCQTSALTYEIIFEDKSSSPFSIHLDNLMPIKPDKSFNRKITKLIVWFGDTDEPIELTLYVRVGDYKLPYLKPVITKGFTRL
jgi:hypothetical protein